MRIEAFNMFTAVAGVKCNTVLLFPCSISLLAFLLSSLEFQVPFSIYHLHGFSMYKIN